MNVMDDPGVSMHGVVYAVGGRRLLDDLTIGVRPGELVVLAGPNGAGKSTALGMLAGDIRPQEGRVSLDGRDIRAWSAEHRAQRRSVMLQQATIAFPYRAREIVAMGLLHGEQTGGDARVDAAMRRTDTLAFADRDVTTLSGGERARIALSRVLVQDAKVMLLDEPTDALDVAHRELMMTILRERADSGRAVLVVLHDLELAAAYADRVVVMAQGRKVAEGAPADVLEPSLLSSLYQHPIDVFPHPASGLPMISPRRPWSAVTLDE
jgi:iron complex transport system ATP-binding protein